MWMSLNLLTCLMENNKCRKGNSFFSGRNVCFIGALKISKQKKGGLFTVLSWVALRNSKGKVKGA